MVEKHPGIHHNSSTVFTFLKEKEMKRSTAVKLMIAVTVFVLALNLAGGCGDKKRRTFFPKVGSIYMPYTLSGELKCGLSKTVPTIDGDINEAEWLDANAYKATLPWVDAGFVETGNTTKALVLVKNDGDNLYMAFRYEDDIWDAELDCSNNPAVIDIFGIAFDEDNSGTIDPGEDRKGFVAIWAGGFFDKYGDNGSDTDSRFDGNGRMRYHASEKRFHVEMKIPLNSGDPNDIAITPGDAIGVQITMYDGFDPGMATIRGQTALFHELPNIIGTLVTVAATPSTPPSLPAFTGRLAFISQRDFEKGDIYVYDFDCDSLIRVTDGNTIPAHDIYKDGVSISNDGQWVAFHGAPTWDDFGNYEIYKIRTDGALLTKLTNSAGVLDGHPAWSPDDSEISYSKFTNPDAADIFVMDPGNGMDLRRLTDTLTDENDSDWSPDGTKIIFKSKRWTGVEQLALMDSDGDSSTWPGGKNVVRLTDNIYSDHDGVYTADGEWILFERYIGPGFWTDSVALLWGPDNSLWCETNWEIWGVRPDGAEVKRLNLAHPCISAEWLPVGERSAENGCVFLRGWGLDYTEILRIPPGGGEPVRLIPDMTRVTYMDWK